jgi:hypothetical protein
MNRSSRIFIAACVALLTCLTASANADIRAKVHQKTGCLKDISLEARVAYSDSNALKKISKDLCTTYQLKCMSIQYKTPDKLRLDANIGIIGMSMVINGNEKGFRYPIRGWQKQSIKGKPHERQTDFDLGIVSDSLWRDFSVLDARKEMLSGIPAYKITFAWANHLENKQVCWIDARTLRLLKRCRMNDSGRLIASYVYLKPRCVSGIWVPTKVEVFSGSGKLAGITEYSNIRVNAGIPESSFTL